MEVPLGLPGDQRAWDALITGLESRIAVEAEVRLYDIQALTRRLLLKKSDSGMDVAILLVRDTPANRRAMRVAWPLLHDTFPAQPRALLRSLKAGRIPSQSGIVLL